MNDEKALNQHYREWRWRSFPDVTSRLSAITSHADKVSFYREKQSHRGIKAYQSIKELIAKQVNQDFLDEIVELKSLEYLSMEIITAEDISGLLTLPNLRYLKTWGLRKAKNLHVLTEIKSLKKLIIENTKYLENLEFLNRDQELEVLGVEGSMYTKQKIPTLEPLSRMQSVEALYLASVRLKDKNLDYLAALPNLKYLSCARFAPKSSFESLRDLMPDLICNWCDQYEV